MRLPWALICVIGVPLLSGYAHADAIKVEGPLTDIEFYNVASCGAAPGGPCKKPHKRWFSDHARDLRVGIVLAQTQVPPAYAALVVAGLKRAIEQINAATPQSLLLTWVGDSTQAEVSVYILNARHSELITGTDAIFLEGKRIANAMVTSNRRRGRITRAAITFTRSIDPGALDSIALEELYQAMGFMYDIDNPAYRGKSVLDERGSDVTVLSGQDLRALQFKYAY